MPAATAPASSAPASRLDSRAEINRRNALKSTGPRTPEGKARSAMNALKSGAFARTPLVPGEDEGEMSEYVGEIIEDLAPATAVERDLAERVAALSWRRRRLWRAEEELFAKELGYPLEPGEADPDEQEFAEVANGDEGVAAELRAAAASERRLAGQAFLARQFEHDRPGPLIRLADHDRRLCGSIDAALRMLMKIQDRREKRDRGDDEAPVRSIPLTLADPAVPLPDPSRSDEVCAAAAPNEPTAVNDEVVPTDDDSHASTVTEDGDRVPTLAARNEAITRAPNEPARAAGDSAAASRREAVTRGPIAGCDSVVEDEGMTGKVGESAADGSVLGRTLPFHPPAARSRLACEPRQVENGEAIGHMR